MGILNVTPDSFSDGGKYLDTSLALDRALEMVDEGADVIDVGGESTRPGAAPVSSEEEVKRVVPVVEKLAKKVGVPLSVDTSKADVAERALDAGADIINDISGLKFDGAMAGVIAKKGAGVVLMHIKGTPDNMQDNPTYTSLMKEVLDYLHDSIAVALEAGIEKEKLIVDPGIGFGKSLDDNLMILKHLDELRVLDAPVLIGTSRKSFIGKILGAETDERLEGSLASSVMAILKGAHMLRVHDVKETVRAATIADSIIRAA